MNEYYTIETGYRKLAQGGYRPEYKLSIPKSQQRDRANRFRKVMQVPTLTGKY
jgi:hypothetical protein